MKNSLNTFYTQNISIASLYRLLTIVFVCFTTTALAVPANDDPCSATAITVANTCTYTSTTSVAATASAGVPAPGCASYTGEDVWYSVTVPANGIIQVDLQSGTMTDSGMALYSGACGALVLISCDDDSGTGAMSYLSASGLTPGATIWVRVWDYGGGTGTFGICVTTPPTMPACASNPAAGETCATATPLCNIDGYCGSTSATYSADAWANLSAAFCGSVENDSYISFVASATSMSFYVWETSF